MVLEAPQGSAISVVLEALAAELRPTAYLDCGGHSGVSLAKMAPRCIVVGEIAPSRFEKTKTASNAVFHLPQLQPEGLESGVLTRLVPEGIGLAFLGGGRLIEETLRYFIQIERASRPGAVIAISDCLPRSERMAERQRRPGGPDEPEASRNWWTGDVWKILPILRRHRPDLDAVVLDCVPCGLVLCRPLDPTSVALAKQLQSIIDAFADAPLDVRRWIDEVKPISTAALVASPDALARRIGRLPENFEALPTTSLFRRQPISERLTLFPAIATPPPLPLFREEELEPEIIREHYERRAPHEVSARLVSGYHLYGGGILANGTGKFFEPDIFPAYLRGVLAGPEEQIPPIWAGSLINPERVQKHLSMPCIMPVHPNLVYGHFLLEVLPKFWLTAVLRRLGDETAILMPNSVQPWVRAFADLTFGKDSAIYYDFKTEEVVAPAFILPSMMHVEHHFHPAFNLMVNDLISRVRPKIGDVPATRRIYLSRSRLRTGWHQMTNEEEIENSFESMGFEIVHPQELSIAEQIVMFSECAVIAGEYSSALHNAIFAPAGSKIIALNRINWYQSRIAALRGHHLCFIRPSDGMWHDWRTREKSPSFNVDLDEVRRYVTGMLAETP